jgi:hypothetical protein
VGLADRLRRLEDAAEREMIVIVQRGGTAKRFPPEAYKEAFMNHMDRLGAGEDAPPEHPLLMAARNSSDPKWLQSVYVEDPDEWVKSVPDLSEP